MPTEVFENVTAAGTKRSLISPARASDAVIQLDGPAAPALQEGNFRVIAINPVTDQTEYMMVVRNQNTASWTVERGIENSDPIDLPQGSIIKHVFTAGAIKSSTGSGKSYIDATLAAYGAVGDGVADDTHAITMAILAAQVAKTFVYLPAGTYLISGALPVLGNCLGILGEGRNLTTIKLGVDLSVYGTRPVAPTVSLLNAAGNLGVGAYNYWVTFVLNGIETTYSLAASVTTVAGSQQVQISNLPIGPAGTTARKIYRIPVNAVISFGNLLTTINDNTTTTFTDNVADANLGAALLPFLDLYPHKIVIDSAGPSWADYNFPNHEYRDFTLMGNTDLWGHGTPARMWKTDGIRLGSTDYAENVSVRGFYFGWTINGDHNNLYNCWGQVNAVGLRHTAPNPADLGNNSFIACKFDNPAHSSMSIAAGSTSQGDLYAQTHFGWGPYCIYKEGIAPPPHNNQPIGEQILDACVFQMCFFEAIGNGVIYDPSKSGVVSSCTFEGIQGFGWGYLSGGQTDVRTNNTYAVGGLPADYAVDVGTIAELRWYGPGLGCGNKGVFKAHVYLFDIYLDEVRQIVDQINWTNSTLKYPAGDARSITLAACSAFGQMSDIRCMYNTSRCVVLPSAGVIAQGDLAFVSSVAGTMGCSRSSSSLDSPVAGFAITQSSTGDTLPGCVLVQDGSVNANLAPGITLSTMSYPGGWLKPTPGAGDGTITVAQKEADYSVGYSVGGQNGQVAAIQVKIGSRGALVAPTPLINFGSGSDGAVVLDGVVTVPWATGPDANKYYVMTRDVFCTNLTINHGCGLVAPYRIFCSGTFTNNGVISQDGGPPTATNGGGGGLPGAGMGGGGAGGAPGQPGVAANNGLGGLGGAAGPGGAAAGALVAPSATNGGLNPSAYQLLTPPVPYMGGSGGGGGTGGGGGGGGVILIFAVNFVNNGAISSSGFGGYGGSAVAIGAGGGAGGFIFICYANMIPGTGYMACFAGVGGTSTNNQNNGKPGAPGTITLMQALSLRGAGALGVGQFIDLSATVGAGTGVGTGFGDKIGLYQNLYGLGIQPGTLVAYVGTGGFGVRAAASSGQGSSGTDAIRLNSTGDLHCLVPGRGLCVSEGANGKQGTATLVAGTVTVPNTSVTNNSRIMLTAQDNNTTGAVRVSARVAGTSFTITSNNPADAGVIAYEIFEPA